MRILFIGDIVGKPGRKIVAQAIPGLRKREKLDLVIANAENAADGSGITPKIYLQCITIDTDHLEFLVRLSPFGRVRALGYDFQ